MDPPAMKRKPSGMMKSGVGPPAACTPAVPNNRLWPVVSPGRSLFGGMVKVLVWVKPTLDT
jgi:hypothetical protein